MLWALFLALIISCSFSQDTTPTTETDGTTPEVDDHSDVIHDDVDEAGDEDVMYRPGTWAFAVVGADATTACEACEHDSDCTNPTDKCGFAASLDDSCLRSCRPAVVFTDDAPAPTCDFNIDEATAAAATVDSLVQTLQAAIPHTVSDALHQQLAQQAEADVAALETVVQTYLADPLSIAELVAKLSGSDSDDLVQQAQQLSDEFQASTEEVRSAIAQEETDRETARTSLLDSDDTTQTITGYAQYIQNIAHQKLDFARVLAKFHFREVRAKDAECFADVVTWVTSMVAGADAATTDRATLVGCLTDRYAASVLTDRGVQFLSSCKTELRGILDSLRERFHQNDATSGMSAEDIVQYLRDHKAEIESQIADCISQLANADEATATLTDNEDGSQDVSSDVTVPNPDGLSRADLEVEVHKAFVSAIVACTPVRHDLVQEKDDDGNSTETDDEHSANVEEQTGADTAAGTKRQSTSETYTFTASISSSSSSSGLSGGAIAGIVIGCVFGTLLLVLLVAVVVSKKQHHDTV